MSEGKRQREISDEHSCMLGPSRYHNRMTGRGNEYIDAAHARSVAKSMRCTLLRPHTVERLEKQNSNRTKKITYIIRMIRQVRRRGGSSSMTEHEVT